MSEFLVDYGLFLAKTLTVVVAAVFIISAAAAASRKQKDGGGLTVRNLNDRYRQITDTLRKSVLPYREFRSEVMAL